MHWTRVAFVAILAAAVVGCQPAAESKTDSKPATASGEKLKVAFIAKSAGNAYFAEAVKGFKEAADSLGVDFTDTAPATGDATSQVQYIKDQIQRKVDVIAISANSPDALNTTLDEAKAKGILVVTVDADLTGNESHRDFAIMSPSVQTVGESQVELLGSQINYDGEFAILSATRDAPNQNAWIAAMTETLKQPKYAKMKLVDTVYGDDEAQKSSTETEGLLSKHPNLKGIIAPTSVGIVAAAQSLDIAGVYPGGPKAKGAGVCLTGLGTPNQMKKFIEKGVVKGFQLWSPKDMGWLACQLAVAVKKGTAKVGSEFDCPKLGKRTFDKKDVVAVGPLVTFDKSNISKFDF